jgi:hypothetical protein
MKYLRRVVNFQEAVTICKLSARHGASQPRIPFDARASNLGFSFARAVAESGVKYGRNCRASVVGSQQAKLLFVEIRLNYSIDRTRTRPRAFRSPAVSNFLLPARATEICLAGLPPVRNIFQTYDRGVNCEIRGSRLRSVFSRPERTLTAVRNGESCWIFRLYCRKTRMYTLHVHIARVSL